MTSRLSTIIRPDVLANGATVYVATDPALPGCMAHGDTPDEAAENLKESRELYLRDTAHVVPAPSNEPWRVSTRDDVLATT